MAKLKNYHIDLVRLSVSFLFIYLSLKSYYSIYYYISVSYMIFAVLWMFFNVIKVLKYDEFRFLAYIPIVMDAVLVTLFISLTGHVNSFAVLGYVLIVSFTQSRKVKASTYFSVAFCTLAYIISGLLYLYKIFPLVNIFGFVTSIAPFQLLIASVTLFFVLFVIIKNK